jgi:GT2 family glycosyltransferase
MTVPVSLLLPNKNNAPCLDLFFSKLSEHTTYSNVELIVVDDGSTDESREILREWRTRGAFPAFTLLECEPRGVSETLNTALERAAGDVIVRMDGDATVETTGWLERMLSFHESDPSVGVIVARIVFGSGRLHSDGRSVIGPLGLHDTGTRVLEKVGHRTFDSCVERPLAAEVPAAIAEVDTALGCCTMFATDLAREIRFDPGFSPVWLEDDDFGLEVRKRGGKVFLLPEIEITHRVGMRNPRHELSRIERLRERSRGLKGAGVLDRVRRRLTRSPRSDGRCPWESPYRVATLRRHYRYWESKWGFDPLNPQMENVLARWGGTEICWAYDAEKRAAGERIISRYLRQAQEDPTRPPAG